MPLIALLALSGLYNAEGRELLSTDESTSTECSNPQPNNCSFYSLCLESRYHCGPSGYPIGYGQKYCSTFDTNRDKLSTAGQEWMRTVMQCLQRKLVPFAGGSQNTTCDDLSQFAFGTYPSCYVDSGLCTLPIQDWVAIVDIMSLPTLFGSLDALKATVEARKDCAEFYLWMLDQHTH